MTILVTGGTGHIGSMTALALQAAGHDVRLLARTPDKVGRVMAPHGATFDDVVQGDITDAASVRAAVAGCDAVVHAAAVVDISRRGAESVLATNALGVRNVVGQALDAGCAQVVHLSSVSALFSPERPFVSADSPVATEANAYGQSKAEAELYCRDLQDQGAPVTIVYPGGVYGPGDPGPGVTTSAVETVIRTGTPRAKSAHWAVVDVRDVADVIVAALAQASAAPEPGSNRLFFGGQMIDMADLNALLRRLSGQAVRSYPLSGRMMRGLGRVNDAIMRVSRADFILTGEGMRYLTLFEGSDDAAAKAMLGRPVRSIEATLHDTLEWMLARAQIDPDLAPAMGGAS